MKLRKRMIYDQAAAQERAFLKAEGPSANILPVICIGNGGTGQGSSIKGFARRGGKWLSKRHGRYFPVAITNEYRTSQTCCFCYAQVIRPLKADGTKCQGSSRCVNVLCPAVIAGRATQGRDKMAAVTIAIAGTSTMLSGKPLAPFDPSFL
jgi:hypothetical protein